MYKVVLCDDDKRLAAQMEYFFKMNSVKIEFETIYDGEDLIQAVNDGAEYDIFLIGNMLKKFNGIQTAKELRALGIKNDIIFISGIDCFYYDAFEVEAFRFMKKPIDWTKFRDCMQLLLERLNENNKYFYYKKENVIHKILIDDIYYFESSRRLINIVTKCGIFSYYDRLDLVEDYIRQKNNHFIRIHKSYLVNSHHISKYEYSKLHLSNNQNLPISENKRTEIRKEYLNYIDGFVCGTSEKAAH